MFGLIRKSYLHTKSQIWKTANLRCDLECNKALIEYADDLGNAMKTSVIDVHAMLSVLSVDEVE